MKWTSSCWHPRGIQRGSFFSFGTTSQMDPRLNMSGMTEGEKACGVKREQEKVRSKLKAVKRQASNDSEIVLLTLHDSSSFILLLTFHSSLVLVPGDLDVVRIKQALKIVKSPKSNLGVCGDVWCEIKCFRNLAGISPIHDVGLKNSPRRSAIR